LTLWEKRAEFSRCLALLILWAHENDLPIAINEVVRTPEQAALNAKKGTGISKSLHIKGLAADVFRIKEGTVTWDLDEYKPLADYWKTLHPLARAGYDFKSRDAVHVSLEHEGVK
jgi:hypothetical protein